MLYKGHYHCYQLSSWIEGVITISHLEIRDPSEDGLFSNVIEYQYSGSPKQRATLGEATGKEVYEEEETFSGCCFYSTGTFVFLLRSDEAKFIKNIICGIFGRNNIAMSGNMQESTQRRSGNYTHISPLCLDRLDTLKDANPRLELLEAIEKPKIVQFLKKANPLVTWAATKKE